MKKVICVVGPTASGKTKVGIELAKKFNGDIISCDSVAVYKELNIGSAKPTPSEQSEAKHYLVDILEPTEQFTVATCQKMARNIIDNSDNLNILVGGTGLYVASIINNYQFDAKKRDEEFEKKYEHYSNEELYELLVQNDLEATKKIHVNNRKRILRALETALTSDNKFSEFNKKNEAVYDAFIIYLDIERELLYDKINKRVDLMIEAGLEEEVRSLYDRGIKINAIGYQEWYMYFMGLVSKESVIEEIKKNTRHLAKRQKTWFKNQTPAKFYNVNLNDFTKTITEIEKDVVEFLLG